MPTRCMLYYSGHAVADSTLSPQAEASKREDQERAKKEEEERAKQLREEEERTQAALQTSRAEQKEKELAEIKAMAGTANLTSETEVIAIPSAPTADGLAAIGLRKNDEDEDMNFEDDD